jgi:hypothetical protein
MMNKKRQAEPNSDVKQNQLKRRKFDQIIDEKLVTACKKKDLLLVREILAESTDMVLLTPKFFDAISPKDKNMFRLAYHHVMRCCSSSSSSFSLTCSFFHVKSALLLCAIQKELPVFVKLLLTDQNIHSFSKESLHYGLASTKNPMIQLFLLDYPNLYCSSYHDLYLNLMFQNPNKINLPVVQRLLQFPYRDYFLSIKDTVLSKSLQKGHPFLTRYLFRFFNCVPSTPQWFRFLLRYRIGTWKSPDADEIFADAVSHLNVQQLHDLFRIQPLMEQVQCWDRTFLMHLYSKKKNLVLECFKKLLSDSRFQVQALDFLNPSSSSFESQRVRDNHYRVVSLQQPVPHPVFLTTLESYHKTVKERYSLLADFFFADFCSLVLQQDDRLPSGKKE